MYDADARPESYLRAYAEEFDTVEIDSTFYGTPDPTRVARWAASVPAGFLFALKLPRDITHDRRLFACGALVDEFFRNVAVLGEKLGPVLIQLPPAFGPGGLHALETFLPLLPKSVRCAVELRDPAWFEPPLVDDLTALLRDAGVALTLAESPFVPLATMLAQIATPTAGFRYLRWIGGRDTVARFDCVVFDRRAELAAWAEAMKGAEPLVDDVFGYANNTYHGHSPATVRMLYEALGVPHLRPRRIEQTSLFAP